MDAERPWGVLPAPPAPSSVEGSKAEVSLSKGSVLPVPSKAEVSLSQGYRLSSRRLAAVPHLRRSIACRNPLPDCRSEQI